MFKIFNPVVLFRKILLCAKDVRNYRFYRKKINEFKQSGLLKEKGMRTDWLRRVYFVINLLPETLLAGQDLELLEKSRVAEAIAERNSIFTNDGLFEIVQADYRRIKSEDYYAYLIWIKYRPLTEIKDWLTIFAWLTAILAIAFNYHFIMEGITILEQSLLYLKNLYIQINN